MSDPLVSIITPSRNRADMIRLCIESVRAQRYKNIEHIVVDGASEDGTVDILRRYERQYTLKWVSEPDGGMYDAINKGIQIARGSIIAYLNTDDALFPWSVGVAVKNLMGSDAKIIFGELFVVRLGSALPSAMLQFYRPFDFAYYTHFADIGQPTVFFKRAVVEQVGGFDTSYRLLGDCEYWLRCASRGLTLKKVDEVMALQIDHALTLRELESGTMQEERARLLAAYGDPEHRHRYWKRERLRKSAWWRRTMAAFLWNYIFGRDSRWSLFIEYMRKEGIKLSTRDWLVMMLVPNVLRRHLSVDPYHYGRLLKAMGLPTDAIR